MSPRSRDRCTFCEIVRGEREAHVVTADDLIVAFLDRAPLIKGHVLVAPRAHVETLDDVPDDLLTPLFAAVRRMSVAMQKGLGADGSFVSVNTRISQSVPHVHVHVVPRRKGDGLFSTRIIWQRQKYASDTEASAIASRIRAAFDAAPV